jgi:glycosyltransferase involved in cell wall biosynthesis
MTHPRKLLLVQTQAENGGAQEISRLLAEHLTHHGMDVHQLFFYRRTDAFDHVANTIFCARARPSTPWGMARLLINLMANCTRLKPDAVLTFQHYGNILGGIAARLSGTRHIIASQTSAPMTMSTLVRQIDKRLGQFALFDSIVVNSAETLNDYAPWPASYRRRIVKIDHGFAEKDTGMNKLQARQIFGLPDGIVLGCAARLHPLKHLDAAIHLLAHNPAWHLALAGQGEERVPLERLALELGVLGRIYFLGELASAQVGIFLRTLDIFVFPTKAETFGLAAVEAAQAGVPVIANDLPVLRDVLADAEGNPCALFTDTSRPAAFAASVETLLANPTMQENLRMHGQRLRQRYSLHHMAEQYRALIEQPQKP